MEIHAIVRHEDPLRCPSTAVAAQMTLILALEQVAVNVKEPFKRAARNRVSVQAYLLKSRKLFREAGSFGYQIPASADALARCGVYPSAALDVERHLAASDG